MKGHDGLGDSSINMHDMAQSLAASGGVSDVVAFDGPGLGNLKELVKPADAEDKGPDEEEKARANGLCL
eukprot:3416608-Lingulodinium_polyedra.AAC.1